MRPYINKLFARIKKDAELKDSVKLIGIAAGNDKYDTVLEEKKYDFPIIPDGHFKFHQLVGQPPTPFLIFARPYSKGRLLVVDSHLGLIEDTDKLFSMVNTAFKKSTSKTAVKIKKKQYTKTKEALVIPITKDELMQKVRESMVVKEDKPGKIKKIKLKQLGDVYTGVLSGSKKRVFARMVARRIPCTDCHDIFYIYSFDSTGRFIQFVPIDISKLDNEPWDEKDIEKMRGKFKGKSLLKEIPFNSKVDAISSATITSKLVFDDLGKTGLIIKKLTDLGYIEK
jgi:hypothetical protein